MTKIGNADPTQAKLLQEIEKTREHYKSLEQIVDKEKRQIFHIMKTNHEQRMREIVSEFEFVSDVQIVWDLEDSKYKAVRKCEQSI